jgi:hypothetical protein
VRRLSQDEYEVLVEMLLEEDRAGARARDDE